MSIFAYALVWLRMHNDEEQVLVPLKAESSTAAHQEAITILADKVEDYNDADFARNVELVKRAYIVQTLLVENLDVISTHRPELEAAFNTQRAARLKDREASHERWERETLARLKRKYEEGIIDPPTPVTY